jgi:hypothetical protein
MLLLASFPKTSGGYSDVSLQLLPGTAIPIA